MKENRKDDEVDDALHLHPGIVEKASDTRNLDDGVLEVRLGKMTK